MFNKSAAIIVGVIVTILWSSSYIVNVWAFEEGIGPLTLAGARYLVASIVLALVIRFTRVLKKRENSVSTLSWRIILILGFTGYLMAQGLQYAGQFYMTPTQTSLFISIGNTCAVLLVDFVFIRESRKKSSVYALLALSIGVLTFYYPWELKQIPLIGVSLVLFSSVGYALNLSMNRTLLTRRTTTRTEDLIIFPMLIGAVGLLGVGLTIEELPSLTPKLALLILWLGSVNGALAFYLWTWTQKHLKAFESSLLNNLMLVEIALMDVIFLQRQLTIMQVAGILFVAASIAYVQVSPRFKKRREPTL